MSQHTPGPWRNTGEGVEVGQTYYTDDMRPEDINQADLRLIAAAPDLLAALESIRDGKLPGPMGIGAEALLDQAQEIARDAIAKATGR